MTRFGRLTGYAHGEDGQLLRIDIACPDQIVTDADYSANGGWPQPRWFEPPKLSLTLKYDAPDAPILSVAPVPPEETPLYDALMEKGATP